MLKTTITPSFADTDALGHINNASIVVWFEDARRPIFRLFVPDLDPKKWNLILAKIEVDYKSQATYTDEVEITTIVEEIGNSSVTIFHEAFQNGQKIASGTAVLVHYSYKAQKSISIPENIRKVLEKHKLI